MPNFCETCGAPLVGESRFCTKCGTRAIQAPAAAPTPAAVPAKSGIFKFLLFLGFIFLLFLLLGMGSCAYVAYKAKKKIETARQAYNARDINKLAGSLGVKNLVGTGTPGSTSATSASPAADYTMPDSANWKSMPPPATAVVPLKKDLILTGAVSSAAKGDYETIITFLDTSPQGITLDYTYLGPPANSSGRADPTAKTTLRDSVTKRTVLAPDLATAHEVYLYYSGDDPKVFPGTTSMQVSTEVFNELKSRGETAFTYKIFQRQTPDGAVKNLLGQLMNNGSASLQNLRSGMVAIPCTLRKATPDDVAMPMIVNDKPVDLPAIHVVCQTDQDELHLYLLDDPQNPLRLAESSRLGHWKGQTIRISYPEDTPENPVEQDLKKTRRALLYGIYFDFGSAVIRPQSEPVLKEIAKAMADNPDWKLTIEGHTDNIGNAAANLSLSQRRSAAVVDALTSKYHVTPDRFSSAGFGASHPIDTNDTIAGRARNRRVELALQ